MTSCYCAKDNSGYALIALILSEQASLLEAVMIMEGTAFASSITAAMPSISQDNSKRDAEVCQCAAHDLKWVPKGQKGKGDLWHSQDRLELHRQCCWQLMSQQPARAIRESYKGFYRTLLPQAER